MSLLMSFPMYHINSVIPLKKHQKESSRDFPIPHAVNIYAAYNNFITRLSTRIF